MVRDSEQYKCKKCDYMNCCNIYKKIMHETLESGIFFHILKRDLVKWLESCPAFLATPGYAEEREKWFKLVEEKDAAFAKEMMGAPRRSSREGPPSRGFAGWGN